MWRPHSTEQVLEAITDGHLPHESASFEVKASLPVRQNNSDIAVDVAAMSTDGGLIIYGILEDKVKVTFSASPIDLSGAKDRISDVVTSSIQEPVEFEVQLYPLPDNPGKGFAFVYVPASTRAPHLVESKGQHRFYGRSPGGNVLLTESQVAALYRRREEAERNADRALDEAIAAVPLEPRPGERGDFHFVAKPLLSNDGLFDRVWTDDIQKELRSAVISAWNDLAFVQRWDPKVTDIITDGRVEGSLDGHVLSTRPFQSNDRLVDAYVSRLEVLTDGTVRFFRANVTDNTGDRIGWAIRDPAVAQMTAHVCLLAGRLLRSGGYSGPVDLGVCLTELTGAASATWLEPGRFSLVSGPPRLSVPEYRSRGRVAASKLVSEPRAVASKLFERLFRVIRPSGFPDPLACPDECYWLGGPHAVQTSPHSLLDRSGNGGAA
ncbi:MAG: helix-turn-helix domain-containing protein [Acidimicrobiales bacterium]